MSGTSATTPYFRIPSAETDALSVVQVHSDYQKTSLPLSSVGGTYVVLASLLSKGNLFLHASVPYSEFEQKYGTMTWKYDVAGGIVRSLRRKDHYLQTYIDYLQGEITKHEFKEKSQKLAVASREPSDSTISECQIACELIGEGALDAADLSVLLDLDTISLEAFLKSHEPKRNANDGSSND